VLIHYGSLNGGGRGGRKIMKKKRPTGGGVLRFPTTGRVRSSDDITARKVTIDGGPFDN